MTPRPGDVLRAMADSYAMSSPYGGASIEQTIVKEALRISHDATARVLRAVADIFDACAPPDTDRCEHMDTINRCILKRGHTGTHHIVLGYRPCLRNIGSASSVCLRPLNHAGECSEWNDSRHSV